MKIFATYTKTHKEFLPWFNTIKEVDPNLEVFVQELEQISPTGEYNKEGWNKATLQKIQAYINFFEKNNDECYIFSDIDVQFFSPISTFAGSVLKHHDIVFQNDYENFADSACTGFFYCKNTKIVKDFLHLVKKNILYFNTNDQHAAQISLQQLNIKYALLPKEFFTYGMLKKGTWNGENFDIPNKIVMHHSNWVVGIENKCKLLEVVKNKFYKI